MGRLKEMTRADLFNFAVAGVPVQARVWTVPRSIFPEQQEMPELFSRTEDVGLALSGGGIRASCESFGVLQALHKLGLLSKVRYVSSNSGSSWLNAPFSYLPADYDLDQFFDGGKPLGPAALSPERLEEMVSGSFLDVASKAHPTKSGLEDLLKDDLLVVEPTTMKSWNEAVTCAYLHRFGLYDAGSVMSTPVGTDGYARAVDAISETKARVTPLRQDAPFPIINCSELHDSSDAGGVWYPYEFTPLYSGIPMKHEIDGASIGGGLIESFGVGATGAYLPRGQKGIMEDSVVDMVPVYWCPLPFAAGTSSGAPYTKIDDPTQVRLVGGEVVPAWSPSDLSSHFNGFTVLADGGATDNTAVTALIRRSVKRIIACLDMRHSPAEPNFASFEKWPSLFGRAETGVTVNDPAPLNARSQIFESAAFDELIDRARQCVVAGKPAVVHQNLEVLANPRCGVAGGYRVEMCWIFNALSDNFKGALPVETQALLNAPAPLWRQQADRDLAHILVENEDLDDSFPHSTTFVGNYTRRLIRMHSELMAYNLLEGVGEKKLKKIFGCSG